MKASDLKQYVKWYKALQEEQLGFAVNNHVSFEIRLLLKRDPEPIRQLKGMLDDHNDDDELAPSKLRDLVKLIAETYGDEILERLYSRVTLNHSNEEILGEFSDPEQPWEERPRFCLLSVYLEIVRKNVKVTNLEQSPIGRICYRGDDRPPYGQRDGKKGVFEIGFKKDGDKESPYNLVEAPYVASEKAVAVSRSVNVAALFPTHNEAQESWIYVVYLERGVDVSTHGYSTLSWLDPESRLNGQNWFFAQEICADHIPPNHVIAAFKVNRDLPPELRVKDEASFYGNFPSGGTFTIEGLVYNEAALTSMATKLKTDPERIKSSLRRYCEIQQKSGPYKIAGSEDGYVKKEQPPVSLDSPIATTETFSHRFWDFFSSFPKPPSETTIDVHCRPEAP